MKKTSPYGKELILDLHHCDVSLFNRKSIRDYFEQLCALIDMEACDLHFWDDVDVPEEDRQTDPRTKGTSAIQFIITSNITIHTLDLLGAVYVNLFSCKTFDADKATTFTVEWFKGQVVNRVEVARQ